MKTYSVKEISELLKTSEETVRRWIRSGKLEAIQNSRKEGNAVTEQMLYSFLKKTPKYAGALSSLLVTPVGIGVATATVLGGILTHQYVMNEQTKNAQVNATEIVKVLKTNILTKQTAIKRKQETIKQLQCEISEDEEYIEETKRIIRELKENQTEME